MSKAIELALNDYKDMLDRYEELHTLTAEGNKRPAPAFSKAVLERRRRIKAAFQAIAELEKQPDLATELADLKEIQQADYAHAVRNCEIANKLEAENERWKNALVQIINECPHPTLPYGKNIVAIAEHALSGDPK